MGWFDDLLSGAKNLAGEWDEAANRSRCERLERRLRRTDAQSRHVGDFRWQGGPDDVSTFSVVYAEDPAPYTGLHIAVLADAHSTLYLLVETLLWTDTAVRLREPRVSERRIEAATVAEIMDFLQRHRQLPEPALRSLLARLQGIAATRRRSEGDPGSSRPGPPPREPGPTVELRRRRMATGGADGGAAGSRSTPGEEAPRHARGDGGQGERAQERQGRGGRQRHDAGGQREHTAAPGRLSRGDALEMFGLQEGASEQEIQAAYRRLAQKLHPDRDGGSAYFMRQIATAREVLLGKRGR